MAVTWISLPNLSADFFAMRSLLSIASVVGKPIAIDKATQTKSRPNTPRVKVILDLLDKHPKRVRLQSLDKITGKIIEVFQEIVYDNLPLYCNLCKHQGHDENTCRFLLKKTHNEVAIEKVQFCQEQTAGEKYSGDLRQLLNERRDLNDGDRCSGEKINPSNEKVDTLGLVENTTAAIVSAEANPTAPGGALGRRAIDASVPKGTDQLVATGDRASMETIAAVRSEAETNAKGTGQNIEAVAIGAAVPIESGQKFEKKKDAGDDIRLKDISASTVFARMYTALGRAAQVEGATVSVTDVPGVHATAAGKGVGPCWEK